MSACLCARACTHAHCHTISQTATQNEYCHLASQTVVIATDFQKVKSEGQAKGEEIKSTYSGGGDTYNYSEPFMHVRMCVLIKKTAKKATKNSKVVHIEHTEPSHSSEKN